MRQDIPKFKRYACVVSGIRNVLGKRHACLHTGIPSGASPEFSDHKARLVVPNRFAIVSSDWPCGRVELQSPSDMDCEPKMPARHPRQVASPNILCPHVGLCSKHSIHDSDRKIYARSSSCCFQRWSRDAVFGP